MAKYARGSKAWGECQRSGRRMLLKDMVSDGYYPDLIVDPAWRDGPHPQEYLPGLHDPEGLYRPAPTDLPGVVAPVLSQVTTIPGFQRLVAVALTSGTGTERAAYSDDYGRTWSYSSGTDNTKQWSRLAYSTSLDRLVTVSPTAGGAGSVMYSDDHGTTWTQVASADDTVNWRDVAWSPSLGLFCAVGSSGSNRVMTSPDGITWTLRTASLLYAYGVIEWIAAFGLFIASADSNAGSGSVTSPIMTSPDGINWTSRSIGFNAHYSCIAYDSVHAVVHLRSGTTTGLVSSDGINYTNASNNGGVRAVAADDLGNAIAMGPNDANQQRNTAGTANGWAAIVVSNIQQLWALYMSNGEFLTGGASNDLAYSNDGGLTWNDLTDVMLGVTQQWSDAIEIVNTADPFVDLSWTEATTKASQINRYEVYRVVDVLPSDPDFLTSFSLYETIAIERDYDTTILNNPYTLNEDTTEIDLNTHFYSYFVRAIPEQGSSVDSNIIGVSTPLDAFDLHTVTQNYIDGGATLTWDTPTAPILAVKDYQIWRSEDGGDYEQIDTVLVGTNTYDDTTAETGHSYSYYVVARNTNNVGTASDIESVTVSATIPIIFTLQTQAFVGRSVDNGQTFSTVATPSAQVKSMQSMAWSQEQNRVVIVSQTTGTTGSKLIYSDDGGQTWQDGSDPGVATSWRAIEWSPTLGLWVLAGDRISTTQHVYTSPTGIDNWTLATTGIQPWAVAIKTIIWDPDNALFCMFGTPDSASNDDHVATSPDGTNWTIRTAAASGQGHGDQGKRFGGAIYIFGTGSATLMRSTDGGVTWAGGNTVFGSKNNVHGLADQSKSFMCRSTNAVTTTTVAAPLLQADWSGFTDLGAQYFWIEIPGAAIIPNLVIISRVQGRRLSTDNGDTFGSEIAWEGGLLNIVNKVIATLLVAP